MIGVTIWRMYSLSCCMIYLTLPNKWERREGGGREEHVEGRNGKVKEREKELNNIIRDWERDDRDIYVRVFVILARK